MYGRENLQSAPLWTFVAREYFTGQVEVGRIVIYQQDFRLEHIPV